MNKIEMFYENFHIGEDEYCAVIRIAKDVNQWLNDTKTEFIRVVSITHLVITAYQSVSIIRHADESVFRPKEQNGLS